MSEPELLSGCQRNESRYQTAFYHRYKGRLMGICRRYARNTPEAEDILQEVFIRVFRHIGTLQHPDALWVWLKKTATHASIDYYRAAMSRQPTTGYEELGHSSDDHWQLMDRLSTEEIVTLINGLPNGYRLVFNLHVIDGHDHAQIADMLGISENTSRSQLFKARDMLRKRLHELGIANYEKHG